MVDLGAAPGGWSQIAAKRVRSADGKGRDTGRVVAIDILDMDPMPASTSARSIFSILTAPDISRRCSAVRPTSCLSDMAANATGHARPII